MSIRDHRIYTVTVSYEKENRIPIEDSLDGDTLPTGTYKRYEETVRVVAPAYTLGEELVRVFALDQFRHMGYKLLTIEKIENNKLDGLLELHTY